MKRCHIRRKGVLVSPRAKKYQKAPKVSHLATLSTARVSVHCIEDWCFLVFAVPQRLLCKLHVCAYVGK